ncbi:MAG: TlpA family protein disulfide reductase [Candidatus Omnitrophota bacterium]
MKRVVMFGLILVLAAAVLTPVVCAQFDFFGNPLLGQDAPDMVLPDIEGKTQSLAELRDGRPAILFFWATWCPHCRTQIKELNAQAQTFAEQGIAVILVDLAEEEGPVAAYLKQNNITFPALLDQTGTAAKEYAVVGVPTFYYLNEDGEIMAVEHQLAEDYSALLGME